MSSGAGVAQVRPPGSDGERAAAAVVEAGLGEVGFPVRRFTQPALRGPLVLPFLAVVLRAVSAGGRGTHVFTVLGLVAMWLAMPGPPIARSRLMARVPGLGRPCTSVSAAVPGADPLRAPPIVVVTRLDAHPGERPLAAWHEWVAFGSALVAALSNLADGPTPRTLAWVVLAEAALTGLLLLAASRRATVPASGQPHLLVGLARRLKASKPVRDTHLVAAGGGTVGASGLLAYLGADLDLARTGWVVTLSRVPKVDAVPERSYLPPRTTHAPAVRALAQAAIESGEAIDIAPPGPGSQEARAALARGLPAITFATSDDARTVEIVDSLTRTVL
ncbi:MAG TPA: hypothetical protein VM840_06180 [Actinomycetota bacterium]|nr:hypothetical protein [Actinomycetota bacterium]